MYNAVFCDKASIYDRQTTTLTPSQQGGLQSPSFWYAALAATCLGLVGLYTQIFVFPINDLLLAEHKRLTGLGKLRETAPGPDIDSIRQWVQDWKRADVNRLLLAHMAMLMGFLAVVQA